MPDVVTTLISILGGVALFIGFLIAIGKVPLRYNVRNLVLRWRTTLLTGITFTMVIGLLIAMLAFVNGMYRLTDSSGRPDNVILLSAGANDEAFSNLGFSDTGEIETQAGIARSQDDQPLVSKETYLVVNQPIENAAPGAPRRRFLQVRGVEDPQITSAVRDVVLYPGGSWFSSAGVDTDPKDPNRSRIQVVLGAGIARELAQDPVNQAIPEVAKRGRLDVGDTFAMVNQEWVVVGVMDSAGRAFDSEVWAKRSLVGPLFGKNAYSSILVRAKSSEQATKLKEFFREKYKTAALDPAVETEYFAKLAGNAQQFLYAVVILTCVMSLGGIFGVMNTMFAAISQRTKDIGVLQILGYKRWQILVSFLLESIVLALIGGLVGCAIGSLCHGWSMTSIVGTGQGGGKSVILVLTVDAVVIGTALLLTVVMGLCGGLLPAATAMRLKPLDAVR